MTVLPIDFPSRAAAAPSVLDRLRDNHAGLTTAGLFCLAAAAVALSLPLVDGRVLDGVSVWSKPAKFFLSSGAFLLTMAWAFGFVPEPRRRTRRLVWSVRATYGLFAFELGYITFQAARGEPSHFNVDGPAHAALYGAMGVAATMILLAALPLALEIARRPRPGADPAMAFAAALGLGLTVVLGVATGFAIGANLGHAVGVKASGLPLLGWSRTSGDLRAAHFFGMHAAQALPLLAAALAAAGVRRKRWIALGGAAITGATIAVLAQALAGRPFPFG
ncbi:hypothetical protein [Methylopila turkensis]|uniref:Uncharacterized protein n=1 Tax=Methylopila turkensis TaxID=1437816 RepID=A0A9W6N7J3_9HYPH|nr:hypothetical protein [Methylopila turkensis]GLK80426.1 hypothetical protein GCM10008174_21670 [Methylopila turkensis]